MYIRKQRLLTPGPTPLYPPALHAMMASDIHHRTEDFRKVYKAVLADLKEVYGTANDVLCFAASGTGAMEASVSNLFSRGDKVIVCSAGKFGERWVEMARAYGLDVRLIEAPYGDTIDPERVEAALKAEPATKGVFIQASETSTGAEHDVKSIGEIVKQTDAVFIVDAITGLGTMPLDIDGWGLDVLIGGSQKAFMIPPGLAFLSVSPKAWKLAESATLPHFYFDLKKEKQSGDGGESSWTPATSLILALAEALKYVKEIGMCGLIGNAQLAGSGHARGGRRTGARPFRKAAGQFGDGDQEPGRSEFGGDREGVPGALRSRDRERTRKHEGPDVPPRAPRVFRFRGSVRCGGRTGTDPARRRPPGLAG